MVEQIVAVGVIAAAIAVVVGVALFLSKSNSIPSSKSNGPDPGGTFGGVPNIAPGIFDPGTAPPPTYDVTDHVRAYDDQSKPKEES